MRVNKSGMWFVKENEWTYKYDLLLLIHKEARNYLKSSQGASYVQFLTKRELW